MFDINNIAFQVLGYPLSYVEAIATFSGLLSVYWASRENVLTWPAGIVNELLFFLIFYQVHLYANMFLQVVFFITTLYGWYKWNSSSGDNRITRMSGRVLGISVGVTLVLTIIAGYMFSRIHLWLPTFFQEPSAFPYMDSFVMLLSVLATFLLAKKYVETWIMWLIVDVVSVYLYLQQGVYFIALEYIILLGIASYGLYQWKKGSA